MTRREVANQRKYGTMAASSKVDGLEDSIEDFTSDDLGLNSSSSDSSDSEYDKNNNPAPSSILECIDHQPDDGGQADPQCSRTTDRAMPLLANNFPNSSGGYTSDDLQEREGVRFLLSHDTDSGSDSAVQNSFKALVSKEDRKIHHESKEAANTNNNSNKRRMKRRRSSDVENNNNLRKPRLRSVQLSSVRAGQGMSSSRNLKPYIDRMILKDGSTNIELKKSGKLDLISRYSRDIYTTIVDLNMCWVLFLTAIVYTGQWLVFGGVYYLIAIYNGDTTIFEEDGNSTLSSDQTESCISNVHDFVSSFLFSMESETTIGYGSRSMGVVCPGAVTTLVIQCVISAIFDTWVIGLCYAKFTSPYLRCNTVIFAKNAVICTRDGKRCLIVRIANLRKSLILSVSCRARVITHRAPRRSERNDGSLQQDELQFQNGNGVMLTAPMEYCHVIDKDSPLYSIPETHLVSTKQNWFEIVVYLSGVIEATGMVLHAQTSYLSSEIKYKHRYAAILSESDRNNRYVVNFKRFHDTEMEPSSIGGDSVCSTEINSSVKRQYKPLPETLEEESDDVFELPGY